MKTDEIIDLRHAVYASLIGLLPPASLEQTHAFMANLRLPKESLLKFLLLRVSPGAGELTCVSTMNSTSALQQLDRIFGSEIDQIAGFYRDGRNNLCWTVPERSALYPYRSHHGFFNGILCQPLRQMDRFWLLSSASYGGAKAIRLANEDRALFEAGIYKQHRRPVVSPVLSMSFVSNMPDLRQREAVS